MEVEEISDEEAMEELEALRKEVKKKLLHWLTWKRTPLMYYLAIILSSEMWGKYYDN
jgi:hypothetical protein